MKRIFLIYTVLLISLSALPGHFALGQVTGKNDKIIRLLEKECIEQVIRSDDSLGTIRNHSCEQMTLSLTIQNYADGIEQLNFKNCPAGFAEAFEIHKKAWITMLKLTDKYPELRGEMHVLFDQLEIGKDAAAFKKYLKQIWDTWAGIEKFIKDL